MEALNAGQVRSGQVRSGQVRSGIILLLLTCMGCSFTLEGDVDPGMTSGNGPYDQGYSPYPNDVGVPDSGADASSGGMTIELTPRSSSAIIGTIVDFSGKVYGGFAPVVSLAIDGQDVILNQAGEFVFTEIYDEGTHVIMYEATNVLGQIATTWEQITVVDAIEGALTSVSATSVEVGDTFAVGCHSENGIEDVPLDEITYTWAPYDLATPGDFTGELQARRPGLLTVTCIRGSDSDPNPPQVLVVPASAAAVRTHSSNQSWISVTAGTSITVGCDREDIFGEANVTPDPGHPVAVEPAFSANTVTGRNVEFTRAGTYTVRCVDPRADEIEPLSVVVYPAALAQLFAEARGTGAIVGTGSIIELSIASEDEFGNPIAGDPSVVWEVSRINAGGWPESVSSSAVPSDDVELIWLPNSTQGALGFDDNRPRIVFRQPGNYVLRPIGYPIGSPSVVSEPVEIPVIEIPDDFGVPNCVEPVNASAQYYAEGDAFEFRHLLLATNVNPLSVNVTVNGVDLERAPTATVLPGEYRVSDELFEDPIGTYYLVEGIGVARFGANAVEIDYEHASVGGTRLSRMLCTFESAAEYVGINVPSAHAMTAAIGEAGLQDFSPDDADSIRDVLERIAESGMIDALTSAILDMDGNKQRIHTASIGNDVDIEFEPGGFGLLASITLHDIEFRVRTKQKVVLGDRWFAFDVSVDHLTVRLSVGLTRDDGLQGISVTAGPIEWSGLDVAPADRAGSRIGARFAIWLEDESSMVRRAITDAIEDFQDESVHKLHDLLSGLTPYVVDSSLNLAPVERIALDGGTAGASTLESFEIEYAVTIDDVHFGDEASSIHAWGGLETAVPRSPDVVDVTDGGLLFPVDHPSAELDALAPVSAAVTVTLLNQALHSLWRAGMLAHVELTGEDIFAIFGENGANALDVPIGSVLSPSLAADFLSAALGACIADDLVWDGGDPESPSNDLFLDGEGNPVLKGRVVAEAIERCTFGVVRFPLPPQVESLDEDANILVALPEVSIRIAAHPNLINVLEIAGIETAPVYSLRLSASISADFDASAVYLSVENAAVERIALGSDDWTSLEVLLDLAGVTTGGISTSGGFESLKDRLTNLVEAAARSALEAATIPLPRVAIPVNIDDPSSLFRGVLSMQITSIYGTMTADRVAADGEFAFVSAE